MSWSSLVDGLLSLFEQGGLTLWAILLASILLWVLILERYWFHWQLAPGVKKSLLAEWHQSSLPGGSTLALRRVQALAGELHSEARRNLTALQALTGVLPLLGLLGTVSGMIKVFEVITVFGTGNTRGMASGISEALVTTMAGLFTALSGLYFVSDLGRRADELARRFETELVGG